jgi:leucyl-tRNA synthetase
LHDIGAVTTPEPYQRLFHQGLILGEDGEKMSKSRGNVVNPDEIIDEYGADALRLYEMFLGPLDAVKPWSTKNIQGISRYLRKLWNLVVDEEGKLQSNIQDGPESPENAKLLHETIRKVTGDIETLGFNTAISQLMILLNHLQKSESIALSTVQDYLKLLAPLAPHIAEELWARTGGGPSILDNGWPTFEESKLGAAQIKVIYQVNGKMRGEGTFPEGTAKEEILATAKAHERVQSFIEGKTIRKEIYVPGKIVNIVAN